MNRQSTYHVERIGTIAQQMTVWITDLDLPGRRSVTNDAERVVREIYATHGNVRIIYRDTQGDWDELEHIRGVFRRFIPARHLAPDRIRARGAADSKDQQILPFASSLIRK